MYTVCQFSYKLQYTLNTWTEVYLPENGQDMWPKHVVVVYEKHKTKTLRNWLVLKFV